MKDTTQKIRNRIANYIDNKQLRQAIDEIKSTAQKYGEISIREKASQIEENYKYMLMYMAQGAKDPQRYEVYDDLLQSLYSLLDILTIHVENSEYNPTLYYSNYNFLKTHPQSPSIPTLLDKYQKLSDDISIFSLVVSNDADYQTKRRSLEDVQTDIFMRLWCLPQLSKEDYDAVLGAIDSVDFDAHFKRHMVSGISMGLLQQYDKRRIELLMLTYLNCTDIKVSSAALVGLLLGLWKYRNRPLSRRLNEVMQTVKDKSTWSRDLRLAYVEIIRARDTERINRKMYDEVIPRMTKIRPDLMDKINKASLDADDPMSLQENPQWQEMMDKTGITDQLKELTEMQMEGGDVMMSTFANLKSFPFFNNMANWFLPFDANQSQVHDALADLEMIGDIMENAPFLCDSDKYSFVMAVKAIPAEQRSLMVSQLKAQSDQFYQMVSHDGDTDDSPDNRRRALNSYMQNIYRFFKLFYRKGEFYDPFEQTVNLIIVPSLADDFNDPELLRVVAEFYFKLKYMQDAIHVFDHLDALEVGDSSRYQKMGYCYESLSQWDQAIDYYMRAELLDSESQWTMRRLAACYRAKGDYANALRYYRQLADLDPDNVNAAMHYGRALFEAGQLKEALHQFYKVEFLDENGSKALRPLAWTLFVTGDLEGARDYYKRIIDDEPTDSDFLNSGHVALASGDMPKAIELYRKAISLNGHDASWLSKALETDSKALASAGVDLRLLHMIADYLY